MYVGSIQKASSEPSEDTSPEVLLRSMQGELSQKQNEAIQKGKKKDLLHQCSR